VKFIGCGSRSTSNFNAKRFFTVIAAPFAVS